MIPGLELAAQARQSALPIPTQEAIERLHRRVRQIGEHELRLDDAAKGYHMFANKLDDCIKCVLLLPNGGAA